jgi:hypothetical protein
LANHLIAAAAAQVDGAMRSGIVSMSPHRGPSTGSYSAVRSTNGWSSPTFRSGPRYSVAQAGASVRTSRPGGTQPGDTRHVGNFDAAGAFDVQIVCRRSFRQSAILPGQTGDRPMIKRIPSRKDGPPRRRSETSIGHRPDRRPHRAPNRQPTIRIRIGGTLSQFGAEVAAALTTSVCCISRLFNFDCSYFSPYKGST